MKTPHLWTWEGRISLANGKTKWISLTVQPVSPQTVACQSQSQTASEPQSDVAATNIRWTASCCDITAYKQSEIESKQLIHSLSGRLEARTAELAVSQTRLHRLADNVPDVLYEMRLDGQSVVFVSLYFFGESPLAKYVAGAVSKSGSQRY